DEPEGLAASNFERDTVDGVHERRVASEEDAAVHDKVLHEVADDKELVHGLTPPPPASAGAPSRCAASRRPADGRRRSGLGRTRGAQDPSSGTWASRTGSEGGNGSRRGGGRGSGGGPLMASPRARA